MRLIPFLQPQLDSLDLSTFRILDGERHSRAARVVCQKPRKVPLMVPSLDDDLRPSVRAITLDARVRLVRLVGVRGDELGQRSLGPIPVQLARGQRKAGVGQVDAAVLVVPLDLRVVGDVVRLMAVGEEVFGRQCA